MELFAGEQTLLVWDEVTFDNLANLPNGALPYAAKVGCKRRVDIPYFAMLFPVCFCLVNKIVG